VTHSHSYRIPEPYAGQSVVVLGAGASGLDISMELAGVNAQVPNTDLTLATNLDRYWREERCRRERAE